MNSRTATRTWARRTAIAGCAALALGATSLGLATGASAAPAKGFIASPNGMVGLAQTVLISAPAAKGQVVTIGLQNASTAQTLQTTIGSNGYGSVTWTPTFGGSWTINGLGNIISSGSTTINVAAMPTYTVLLAQNNVQNGVNNNLTAAVVAPIGSLAPTGSVYLATTFGNGITTQPLTGLYGGTTATTTLPWTPNGNGPFPIQATYTPGTSANSGSVSPVSQPNIAATDTTVSLRWPATLYVNQPTVLQAVLGQNIPQGSVAFYMDGKGISGSIPTVNGVATLQWTPPAGGVHNISVAFTANQPIPGSGYSGSSTQSVNIQPAKAQDNITVDPIGQPAWSIAAPIVMKAGSNITLAGTAVSGSPIVFAEQGPCYINGAVLYAPSAGSCQISVQSAGNATLTPTTENYTVTVTAPPKKKRG
jgi:hypothetical protein